MSDTDESVSRRRFLGGAGKSAALGLGAVAAAVTGTTASADAPVEETGDYRETAHVKTYYDLARF